MSVKKENLVIGGRYNWQYQQERLIYMGRDRGGIGIWHQFALVDEPRVVWCEVLDGDLNSFEETEAEPEQIAVDLQRHNDYVTGFIEGAIRTELTVPEGFQLVPIEPTPEMLAAFHTALNLWIKEIGEDADVYKAMLEAAKEMK